MKSAKPKTHGTHVKAVKPVKVHKAPKPAHSKHVVGKHAAGKKKR